MPDAPRIDSFIMAPSCDLGGENMVAESTPVHATPGEGIPCGNREENSPQAGASSKTGPTCIPHSALKRLRRHLPFDTYLSLRLVCKDWSKGLRAEPVDVPAKTKPAVSFVPTEILVIIYNMLSPRDFDNARRTCSRWMRVSLDRDLLQRMLKRGGWWRAWQGDCRMPRKVNNKIREGLEWRLSKRLAMECWLSNRGIHENNKRMMMTSVFDFSRLSGTASSLTGSYDDKVLGDKERSQGAPAALTETIPSLDFTVSSCGEFVLVADGTTIRIFRLSSRSPARPAGQRQGHESENAPQKATENNELDVEPITSIYCPNPVLAVSVDTFAGRFAVAALLSARVGMVCEMKNNSAESSHGSHKKGTLEPESTTFFHNLCNDDDPPRSVSVSPERRCVAFGCGSGIELHWVDETSGHGIRRWFPIPVPSDVLHFLPQRAGWDSSSKQLRMVSSAAGPVGIEDIVTSHSRMGRPCKPVARNFYGGNSKGVLNSTLETRSLTGMRATDRDHYRALPLSDGYNMLFTDPETGMLCLGSDVPLGQPTKLMKKIICIHPSAASTDRAPPAAYAAGSNIDWGVRIVAAYRNRIVLFCVPPDVFDAMKSEREKQGDGVMGDSDLARDFFLEENCDHRRRRGTFSHNGSGNWEFLLSHPLETSQQHKLWPIPIVGKEIGAMNDIAEFAVQSSNGGLRIWAFGAAGEARVFDIDTVSSPSSRSQVSDLDDARVGVEKVVLGPDGTIGSTELTDRDAHNNDPGLDNYSSSGASSGPPTPPPEREREELENNKMIQDLEESPFESCDAELVPEMIYAQTTEGMACILDLTIPRLGFRDW